MLIDEATRRDEVERLSRSSPGRIAAERDRRLLEDRGIDLGQLQHTDEEARDGTRLPGLRKIYVPIGDEPASARPFASVLVPVLKDGGIFLRLVAYGERHPPRGTRSVYKRAHKRLHGRYPDQERSR